MPDAPTNPLTTNGQYGTIDPFGGVPLGYDQNPVQNYIDWWKAGPLASAIQGRMTPQEADEWVQQMATSFGEGGMTRGYHGTPHVFAPEEGAPLGRFKDEAIGSGEGAQSYGWGHYVAGNPRVASDYANRLSGSKGNAWYDGDLDAVQTEALQHLNDLGQSHMWAQTPQQLLEQLKNSSLQEPQRRAAYASMDPAKLKAPGSLLEVAIKPNEDELLDWDKPLSSQTPGVQSKIEAMTGPKEQWGNEWDTVTGRTLYKRLQGWQDINRAQTSQALHSAGIPGIKYLDQGSRGVGSGATSEDIATRILDAVGGDTAKALKEANSRISLANMPTAGSKLEKARDLLQQGWKPKRTYNYVIFDPSNLTITARNGQRVYPVDHDPFAEGAPKLSPVDHDPFQEPGK